MPSSAARLTSSLMRTVPSSSEYSVCRRRCTNGTCCDWLESLGMVELYAVQALAELSPPDQACRRRRGKDCRSLRFAAERNDGPERIGMAAQQAHKCHQGQRAGRQANPPGQAKARWQGAKHHGHQTGQNCIGHLRANRLTMIALARHRLKNGGV